MERPLTLGSEDGIIDVDLLLVEPQDAHLSLDSVICFNEKIPKNSTNTEEVSRSFGVSDIGSAREREDILNRKVLDAKPDYVEYFRLHDDFYSMGSEYLLGAEFDEIDTNLDISRIMEVPSHHEFETWADEKLLVSPSSESLEKLHDSSSCSYQDTLSCDETNISAQARCGDVVPTGKRSRKPTKRYIDDLVVPISACSKKRREVSSPTLKEKSVRVKDRKKCHTGTRAVTLPAEEFSIEAIQVPFGSLVPDECSKSHSCDVVHSSDSRSLMTKSKDNHLVTPENQIKKEKRITSVNNLKKRDDRVTTANQKKKDSSLTVTSPKKKDQSVVSAESEEIRDECVLRKHHRVWSIAEVRKLIDGVSQYGVGRWSRIKKLFFSTSAHRTSVDLKDKWRNLLKACGIQEQGTQQEEKKRMKAWRPLPKSILRRVCELNSVYPYPKGQRTEVGHKKHDDYDDATEGGSTDITLSNYRRILQSISDD